MELNRELIEKEQWSEFFNPDSKDLDYYEKFLGWYNASYYAFQNYISKELPATKLDVLEIGCGSGRMSYALGSSIRNLQLIDISEVALAYAKQICPVALKPHTEFNSGSMFELQFEDHSFSLTHSTGVLEHYSEYEIRQALKESIRVTKKGGRVIHLVPNPISPASLKAQMLSSGFAQKYLKFVPGYRNDTEICYTAKQLETIVKTIQPTIDVARISLGPVTTTSLFKGLWKNVNKKFSKSSLSFLTGVVIRC